MENWNVYFVKSYIMNILLLAIKVVTYKNLKLGTRLCEVCELGEVKDETHF